jgi:hypothetical protein
MGYISVDGDPCMMKKLTGFWIALPSSVSLSAA